MVAYPSAVGKTLIRAGARAMLGLTTLGASAVVAASQYDTSRPSLEGGLLWGMERRGETAMTEDRYSATREDMASNFPRYSAAALGFRDYWYPVALSRGLKGKPLARTVLGERIAVFRDAGKLYALPDRCPHRGVPLS